MAYRFEPPEEEPVYTRIVAVQLAQVSTEFLNRLESEGLIRSRRTSTGREGYSLSDVRLLARIWRMRLEMAWDQPPPEAAQTLRHRLLDLLARMDRLERGHWAVLQQMRRRERELLEKVERQRKRLWTR